MDGVVSAWIGVAGLLVAGISAWIKLVERLTTVETRQKSDSDRFSLIMDHLQRIEDKLDKKADR